MSLISLGTIDKTLIVIIVGCIFCFLNRLLNQYNSQLYNYPVLTSICISLSRFLTVIPFIILKIKSHRLNKAREMINTNNKQIKLIYNDKEKQNIKGKWKFIVLSALAFLIQLFFFVYSFEVKTNSWISYILIASIFYYLMFKVKLYKHHYLSILLIILIGLIIDIVTENLQNELINNPLHLAMKLLKEIFYPLYNVIAKYTMERKYVSVYEFSFYVGLILFIALMSFALLDNYYFKLFDYSKYFENFNYIELLVILGAIFTQLGINITTLFTSKNNSPCHVFIIFVFGQMAYYISFKGTDILVIFLLIIILFLSLIFNEIIEINIFGLSRNTKKNIVARAEFESMIKLDISDEKYENDDNSVELNYK